MGFLFLSFLLELDGMSIYEFLGVFLLLFIGVLLSVPRYESFTDAIQRDFLMLKPKQTDTVGLYQASNTETSYLKSLSTKPLEFEKQLLIMDRCLKFKIQGSNLNEFDRNMELLFKNVVFPVKKDSFEVSHFAKSQRLRPASPAQPARRCCGLRRRPRPGCGPAAGGEPGPQGRRWVRARRRSRAWQSARSSGRGRR